MTTHPFSIAEHLKAARLIPVLTLERVEDAVPLARALVAGGVTSLEVTLRTAAGPAAAAAIKEEVPEVVCSLGTVLTVDHLRLSQDLGLPFAFSPGATAELLDAAERLGVLFVPGVATASELMAAQARGFTTVKLFPAEPLGGIAALRALAGPFPGVKFCPTGGIGENQIDAYLAEPNVCAVGGSWLAPTAEIERRDWAGITARARRALAER